MTKEDVVAERLVLSVAEAADVLGVSDDLVYELIARRELPCLRFGRRKVIPRRAIELVIEEALEGFDPRLVTAGLDFDGLDRASTTLRLEAESGADSGMRLWRR